MRVSVAIIAGGQSRRMGSDKSMLRLGGKFMLERVIERLRQLEVDNIFLVTNMPDVHQTFGLKMVADMVADTGSLGGIYTAIIASESHYTFVVPCDMPFLSVAVLQYMISLCDTEYPNNQDVIVPIIDNYPQGLHAIYSKNCARAIQPRLAARRLKVIGFYDAVQVRYVMEEELAPLDNLRHAFFNANTPAELEKARQIIESNQHETST